MDASGNNQVNHKRTDSTSSTGSSGSAAMPRRSSAGSGLFASLQEQKRSSDPLQQARRQSLHDQRPATGILGRWWNNYVHGPTSPPPK